ncbi:hypothetical protein V474_07880 [Novosphingobium barchaimii LL02]|uniref:Uncharacterized protein n=1 Tax=Novosphingobium barchaimii LL02 TaxID=1114963 RepID=A0A0J7Y846_9SPHN|nr:hypothetical protein [Novosphingobium barchaimii]KMS59996.1 hypothetical protein V474_07880 [Novosphingobium barchaimii LL02]
MSGCGQGDNSSVKGYDALVSHVEGEKVGADIDQWIEMKNMAGEWEKTGLIFGYIGDYDECVKAIDGFKRANDAREYRCVPAQK